jgi:neutral ceramidase
VVSLGPLVFATLPGEFSTVMGRRIAERVATARGSTERVVLLGLASEYAGDFTTPQEYALQHYEGASTLYGPASGTAVADELERLATVAWASGERVYRYRPGRTSRWSGDKRSEWSGRLEGAAVRVRSDLDLLAGRPFVSWTFDDARTPWPLGGPDVAATPRVRVIVGEGPLAVGGIAVDDRTDEFALWVTSMSDDRWSWTVTWMMPRGAPPDAALRLQVERVTGDVVCSAPFTLAEVYGGEHTLRPDFAPCETP